jgi:hypothetical protein
MINLKKDDAVADAIREILQQEALKGDQHKIDANKNNKIDAHDFKLLRGKKKDVDEEVKDEYARKVNKYLKKKYNKEEVERVTEGSGPKEKQKTPYRDINSPEYRAAADKQKQRMDKDKAAEPGKKMLSKQGVAEGAPELLKKEMPLHRHAEKLLAQNGVSKDDPDYHHHLGNTIKHLRQFGNIDLINKSDMQGVAEGSQAVTPAIYVKGGGKYPGVTMAPRGWSRITDIKDEGDSYFVMVGNDGSGWNFLKDKVSPHQIKLKNGMPITAKQAFMMFNGWTPDSQQGAAEGLGGDLNEFAPPGSSDGGDDGFSEDTLKQLAAQWYNGDEDPRVEQTLMAAGWEIGQDEGYDDTPGVFVVQAGDINGNSYISWPAHELEGFVDENMLSSLPRPNKRNQFKGLHKLKKQHKQGVGEDYNAEYDDEAGMAETNLHTIARAAQGLLDTIDQNENLPEWVQEKIAKVELMIVSAWDYLESQEEQGIDPEIEEMYEAMDQLVNETAHAERVSVDLVWESFEALDDHMLYETAAWRRKEGKSKKGGLNAKGVASYRRENPGSKLQMAVTTKPSKLKPGSKAAKRRKSFCARMSGVKGPMKKPNGKPTRKALALRKWNC